MARTQVWTEGGALVASFMQEGLVRPPRDWSPDVAPDDALQTTATRTLEILRGVSSDSAKL